MIERVRSMTDDALLQLLQNHKGPYGNEESEAARAEATARGLVCQYGDVQFKVMTSGTQEQDSVDAAQLKKLYLDKVINKHTLIYVPSKDRWLFLSSVFEIPRWDGVVPPPEPQKPVDGHTTGQTLPLAPPSGFGMQVGPGGHGDGAMAAETPAVMRPSNPESSAFALPTTRLDPADASGRTRRKISPVLLAGVAVGILFVFGISGLLYFVFKQADQGISETPPSAETSTQANAEGAPTGEPVIAGTSTEAPARTAPAMVLMQGGNFLMGRSDISSLDPVKSIQYPAHQVSVGTFYIDATEVTNAQYAEFVRETGHEPPRGWGGGAPPAGKETWPVTHVSYADAQEFAAWRSRRDAVTYRLPTEEEWEYAARGGGSQLYPWGNNWVANRANLDAASPKPVGSFPSGMTPQGVQDLIGNVWEWTSSRAKVYPGNEDAEVGSGEQNYMVTRGGAYVSKSSGNEAVTAASRVFAAPTTTHETLGFRLVREGS